MSSQPFREHGERPVAHGCRSDSGCFCVAELALLEDLDYGDIDGICTAARVHPLTGVKKDELGTTLGYFEHNAPACATTGSAPAACSSAPQSWNPAARRYLPAPQTLRHALDRRRRRCHRHAPMPASQPPRRPDLACGAQPDTSSLTSRTR